MSRAIRFHRVGGPDVLCFEDMVVPPPGAGEVRVDVKAIGLNRADASFRSGRYIEEPKFPASLGLEAAGIVESVGEGVNEFVSGQLVGLVPPISMAESPTYVERANFPARMLVASPPQLDAASTAALWMAYLTAYGALIDIAGIGRGDAVAITAASSSVGIAAIQMANLLGAIPIALTRTGAKARALRELGAREVITTDGPYVADRLQAAAGGLGVRVVLDAVGGPLIGEISKAMCCHGQIFEYGGLSSEQTPFPLGQALGRQLLMRGYLVHHVTANPGRLARAEDFIRSGVESGMLRPVIDKIFPFDRVVDAHRWLEGGHQIGKIVLQV
ncbi:NADPH:quinone reductase-like Zn-dependent oxidoreductase [Sphingomonas naasensis]|uniref:NADPH:quinone reductase n=1 Tax=Sphingomonas naasensis TaxID=1344951 RepID=A0A4S1W604_9SPHN|nr:zinc-dependent alcohol dehydrogenase family protein [Sphingomonas naasensis]NIJ21123.1 NADPH:quinone reductase-like Zn-dependent oxidoreductase [Sphingomonas naasensis]TGX38291.1 NADPH:quinone reductase [Sphingomonas naasensis]